MERLGKIRLELEVSPYIYVDGYVWGRKEGDQYIINLYVTVTDSVLGSHIDVYRGEGDNQDAAILQALGLALGLKESS